MTKRHPAHPILKSLPLFAAFSDADIAELLEFSEPVTIYTGEHIVRQGENGCAMFLLTEGDARVVLNDAGGVALELAKLSTGDFIGEMALVDNQPRSADVIATTDCMVMKITTGVLRLLSHESPAAAFKLAMAVLEIVGQRLRQTNTRYLDSVGILSSLSGELSRMADHVD